MYSKCQPSVFWCILSVIGIQFPDSQFTIRLMVSSARAWGPNISPEGTLLQYFHGQLQLKVVYLLLLGSSRVYSCIPMNNHGRRWMSWRWSVFWSGTTLHVVNHILHSMLASGSQLSQTTILSSRGNGALIAACTWHSLHLSCCLIKHFSKPILSSYTL